MNDRIDFLEDALKHIINTAERSRTQTKRLAWIIQRAEDAINGVEYNRDSFTLPARDSLTSPEYEFKIRELKRELKTYKEMTFVQRIKFLFKGDIK